MTPESIREMATAFQKSRIFLSAFELGIFGALGRQEGSSEDVARKLGTDPRATDRLLNALVVMGFILKEGDKFRNSASAEKFLIASSPDYLPGLMHTVHLWDTWSTLTEAVKRGTSMSSQMQPNADPANWTAALIAAMNDRARKQAPIAATLVGLKEGMRILDVGGGSGAFAVAFVRAKEKVTATIFDLPHVLPLTAEYVRVQQLSERIDYVAGDYTRDPLPSGYDLVFLSAIIHSNPPEENGKLIRKCAGALNPGGAVVVQDFIMDESRTQPPGGAFFALNMLVNTAAGDTYTESEVREWMKDAGLSDITKRETPWGASQMAGKR